MGPRGIALDPRGSGGLYIADFGGNRIRFAFPNGTLTTLVGNGSATSVDGRGAAFGNTSTTYTPNYIAVDTALNVFWVEQFGGKVRRFSSATNDVTTIAGRSVIAADVYGFLGISAFNSPWSLALDPGTNTLYVLSQNTGNKVRRVTCGLCPPAFFCATGYSAPANCTAGGYCPRAARPPTPALRARTAPRGPRTLRCAHRARMEAFPACLPRFAAEIAPGATTAHWEAHPQRPRAAPLAPTARRAQARPLRARAPIHAPCPCLPLRRLARRRRRQRKRPRRAPRSPLRPL